MTATAVSEALKPTSFTVDEVRDLQPLMERLSSARVVLLGESTHGTEEFYQWRRLITQWLITKHGFTMIAVEGDWPLARKIHRYIRGREGDHARGVLEGNHRWPTWVWANTEVIRLLEWLRSHNARPDVAEPVSFCGLDMYSLFESIESVIRYLEEVSPLMARRAKKRYACFDQFSGDEMLYARSTLKLPEGCAEEVTHNLEDLLKLSLASDVRGAKVDDLIDAQQSARVVQSAARYYRAMIRGDNESWNIRDRHMMETLSWLLAAEGREHKAVVWAHNTHVGDYRATDMTKDGLVNLGGLARERLGEHEVAIVGFGSYDGRMVAARAWDGPLQEMAMPPAKKDSLDAVYHSIAREWRSDRIVTLFGEAAPTPPLRTPLDQRAIGVVFDPDHERGNYTSTVVSSRYDAYFHIDRTTALTPLVLSHEREKIPATWPLGR